MRKTICFSFVIAMGAIATSAYAIHADDVAKVHELSDGSTLYIFKDGKMGMEDKFGRPLTMREGQVMETKEGRRIEMAGNEVWRVERILEPLRGR